MKFYVTYKVEARYTACVEANDLDEALELAEGEFLEADFGEAKEIEGETIYAEDEDNNWLWQSWEGKWE